MEPSWNHDIMLSIHSYYVNEFQAGLRASERILLSDAPDNIKFNASQNISYYISPIYKNYPVKYTELKTDLVKEGWSLMNPTIIKHGSDLMLLVRSSNYLIDDEGNYFTLHLDSNGVPLFRTDYFKFILNSNLEIQCVSSIKMPTYDKTNFSVDGIEDLRIFDIKNSYWVSGNIRNMKPYDHNSRVVVCKFDEEKSEVLHPKVIETDVIYEKNWMPVLNQENIKWVHHPNINGKTSVIFEDENDFHLKYNDCNFNYATSFRGGTQLVPYNGKYYSIIHLVTLNEKKKRIYYHKFCEWDSNFNLLRFGKSFYLKEYRTIEFAAGMSIFDENVHISFGINDKEAWIATISIETMLSLLNLDLSGV